MKKEIKRAIQSFWRLLLLMVAFNSSLSLFAQTQTISGIVLDEFGDPMIGVSVLVKGNNHRYYYRCRRELHCPG